MADNQMDEYEAQNLRIRERMDRIGRKIMIMSGLVFLIRIFMARMWLSCSAAGMLN